MIDPAKITNFQLTTASLQAHLIFWVLAAGKSGARAAQITNTLIKEYVPTNYNLFTCLRNYSLDDIVNMCYRYGTGCHNNKGRSIYEVVNKNLDLKACTYNDLESIFGIGRKTSRCFIMHSRKNAQCAGLDTHILKFLRVMGIEDVPKTTPSSKKQYERLEQEFLILAKKYKKEPVVLDLMIWNEYSIKLKGD